MCPLDKRRRYEQRHRDAGLCLFCPDPPLLGTVRCFRHWAIHKLNNRGYPIPQGVTTRNKREKLVASWYGRYQAVKEGKTPVMFMEALKEAKRIREELNIRWGGPSGAVQMALLLQAVERKASE
jgi:hypothetical protein